MKPMKHIRVEREGAVGILTIARRERLNSLDVETAQDFRRAGLQLARDRDVRAVIIRGEGGIFCSGADLKYIRDGATEMTSVTCNRRPANQMKVTERFSNKFSNTSTARFRRYGARRNHSSPRSMALPLRAVSELR